MSISIFSISIVFLGIIGISSGVAATVGIIAPSTDVLTQMGATMAVGGTIGALVASRIAVTDLPQLVALFHSFVGLAAVLTSVASFLIDQSEKCIYFFTVLSLLGNSF